jgi:hypothetical protein
MAILFVSNSADELGAALPTTSAVGRDSDYSPNSVYIDGIRSLPYDKDRYIQIELDPAVGDLWVHYRVKLGDNADDGSADGYYMQFLDADSSRVAYLDANNGDLRAAADGDTVVLGSPLFIVAAGGEYTIDMRVSVGANIEMDLYVDGAFVHATAIAANTGGKGVPVLLSFDHVDVARNSIIFDTVYYSEVIITDGEDTRGWRLATLDPDAVGGQTDWTGGFAELGDIDGSSWINTNVDGARVSSNISAYTGEPAPTSVRAVIASATAQRGQSGVADLAQFLRIAGTDYDGALNEFVIGERKFIQEVWGDNPNTGSSWVVADLASLEVGLVATNTPPTPIELQNQRMFGVVTPPPVPVELQNQRMFGIVGGLPSDVALAQQRMYGILGSIVADVGQAHQRLFAIVGSPATGFKVQTQDTFAIVGGPPTGVMGSTQENYVVGGSTSSGIFTTSQETYVIVT